jgi:hypothetical protein
MLLRKNLAIGLFSILVCASWAFGQSSPAQVRHGTIILFEDSFGQIIIAADSKYHPIDKTACKIEQLSTNTVFFYTGNVAESISSKTYKTLWSQNIFAAQAYGQFKDEPPSDDRLMEMAAKYEQIAHPKIDSILKGIPNPNARAAIGLAGFVSLNKFNQPRLALVNFTVEVPNDGVSPAYLGGPSIAEWGANKLGMGNYNPYTYVNEFLSAVTPRAEKAKAKFEIEATKLPEQDREARRLIAAIDFALEWDKNDPSIGPPVDAVVIEPTTGIRWIQGIKRCHGFNTVSPTFPT